MPTTPKLGSSKPVGVKRAYDDQFAISLNGCCVGYVGAMIKIGHHSTTPLKCRNADGPECRVEDSVERLRNPPLTKKVTIIAVAQITRY